MTQSTETSKTQQKINKTETKSTKTKQTDNYHLKPTNIQKSESRIER